MIEHLKEPLRTSRGLRIIECRLFHQKPHGSHRYIRGDERVVCPGIPKTRLYS